MILWSTKENGPWTAFQSSARIFYLLKDNYPMGTGNGNLWLPRRGFKRNALNTINLQGLVEEVLKKPNKGSEDERFELDLKKISELIKKGEFYICGARRRTLLDPCDERIRWTDVQETELGNLRQLLHPQFLATTQEKLDPAARVVQAVFYATEEKLELTAIEQAVLWRMSHLYPVLSFCELIVALGFPKQDSGEAPSVLGAVVAAKSALELTAHFVVGGTNNFDPFDDAMRFEYRQSIEGLGKIFDEWEEASGWYDELSDVIKLKEPFDNKKILETCKSVLQLVCKVSEFQKPITASGGTIVLMEFGAEHFEAPKENYAVLTYRTDFDPCPWPLDADTIDHSMSWTGIYSPRLEALGYTKVKVFDSPNLVDSAELLERLKGFKTDGAAQKVEAAISLVRAFCICHNLGNILALGAIARELHLVVEKLTVTQNLDMPRDDKAPDKTEDDKSLKCIASGLTPELNTFRTGLQNILASFAHPGWLIRTELLRVKDDKNPLIQALFITANYAPNVFGSIELVDDNRTTVELIPTTSSAESRFSQVIMNFPEDLRVALTGKPNGAIKSGEAIDVPFVAFNLCQQALSKILDKP